MTRGGLPLIGWGLTVALIALFGVLAFGLGTLPAALLAGGGLAAMVTGLAAQAVQRPRLRAAPDLSLCTVAGVCGLTVALVGVTSGGAAFAYLGVGLIALAVAGLVGESVS